MAYGSGGVAIHIVLLGDCGVGKSSLLQRLKTGQYQHGCVSIPTVGYDHCVKNFTVDDVNYKLTVWDTAGMERYRTLTRGYFMRAQAVILVYGVNDRRSLEHLKEWKKNASEHTDDVLWAVAGNKSDLRSSFVSENIHDFLVANKCHCAFQVSAKSGYGVDSMFEKLAVKTAAYIRSNKVGSVTFDRSEDRTIVDIKADKSKRQKCCKWL